MVKIGDFGITKQIDGNTELRTAVGTFAYAAPEALDYHSSETSVYTNAVDIWSLGCVVHVVITGKTPFPHVRKLMEYIEGQISFPRTKLMENGASPHAIKFIASLMEAQPEDRLTAEQALKAPWINADMGEEEEDIFWTEVSDRKDSRLDLKDNFWTNISEVDSGLSQVKSESRQDYMYLGTKDLCHFSSSCRQLLDLLRIWCDQFSRFSAGRTCVPITQISDEASRDHVEDVMLDDRGVRRMLEDEKSRSEVFVAIAMRVIWEQVFSRFLFGLGHGEVEKLLSLEKTLAQCGTHEWASLYQPGGGGWGQ